MPWEIVQPVVIANSLAETTLYSVTVGAIPRVGHTMHISCQMSLTKVKTNAGTLTFRWKMDAVVLSTLVLNLSDEQGELGGILLHAFCT